MTGRIFDIKEFAVNDGEGIRTTVFFKGCPLRCLWCHNPEGLSAERELSVLTNGCMNCGLCKKPCSHEECRGLGRCLHICPKNLVRAVGEDLSAQEAVSRVMKHRDIYRATDGGVTLSGGEPLMQPRFALEILSLLRGKAHRAMETSGYASEETFRSVISECDFVYMDLKLADSEQHLRYTGVKNEKILRNAQILKDSGIPHTFRIPLIPGITDTDENLAALGKIVGNDTAELLLYNNMAGAKYPQIGKTFPLEEHLPERKDEKAMLSYFSHAFLGK